jgi:hypothetical protein
MRPTPIQEQVYLSFELGDLNELRNAPKHPQTGSAQQKVGACAFAWAKGGACRQWECLREVLVH